MSLITPRITVSGAALATAYLGNGVKIEASHIGFGKGFQAIPLNNDGFATVDTMAHAVGRLPIAYAENISGTQKRMSVDVQALGEEDAFNLSELTLEAADGTVIAIYSAVDTALMAVNPLLDSAVLSLNLTIASLPEGSLEIVHLNTPLSFQISPSIVNDNMPLATLQFMGLGG